MWVTRALPPANPDLAASANGQRIVGVSGATRLLGQAVSLRTLSTPKSEKVRQLGHQGPYLPVVYEACREQELAYEYRHGVISHGAFTYALAAIYAGTVRLVRSPRTRPCWKRRAGPCNNSTSISTPAWSGLD